MLSALGRWCEYIGTPGKATLTIWLVADFEAAEGRQLVAQALQHLVGVDGMNYIYSNNTLI